MQPEPVSVSLSYPDGSGITFLGQGAIVYASGEDHQRLTAVTGQLTLGDVAQLMTELVDSFGPEEICLALGLAIVSRRLGPEDESPLC